MNSVFEKYMLLRILPSSLLPGLTEQSKLPCDKTARSDNLNLDCLASDARNNGVELDCFANAFKDSQCKSILCLNGRLPDKAWFLQQKDVVIVAADGAANKLIANRITPDFIIGDLDSLEQKYRNSIYNIIRIEEQDTTDFDKCLREMEKIDLFPALVLGIGGGEIDHNIYNLNLFMQHAKFKQLVFLDVDEKNNYKLGIPLFEQYQLSGQIGRTVSLLPFPEAIVSTAGLKWDITQMRLSVGGKASVRNVVISNDVVIKIHNGVLLMILDLVDIYYE